MKVFVAFGMVMVATSMSKQSPDVRTLEHKVTVTSTVPALMGKTVELYVRERAWHPSQEIEVRGDGGLGLRMNVCNDYALRAWVLGFGPSARVIEPQSLAQSVIAAVVETRRRYARGARMEMLAIKAS